MAYTTATSPSYDINATGVIPSTWTPEQVDAWKNMKATEAKNVGGVGLYTTNPDGSPADQSYLSAAGMASAGLPPVSSPATGTGGMLSGASSAAPAAAGGTTAPAGGATPVGSNGSASASPTAAAGSSADANTLANWYQSYQSSNPGATPSAAAATWTPDANSTVQGQLKGILDAGGPLMTRAETRALQQMNARGLLNSSMAVGAGQAAVMDAAMPIAQADAGTYATSQRENTAAENAVRQQAAGFQQQSNLQAADIAAQERMQGKDLASRYDLANMDAASKMALQKADAENQQKLQASDQIFKSNLQTQSLDVQQSMQKYNLSVQQAMQGKDNDTKMAIATLDAKTQETVATINNQYKTQLQTSASMSNTYSQYMASIAQIMADPNMDAAAKDNMITKLTGIFQANMDIQSTISGLDLGKLMVPGATPNTTTPTTPDTGTGAGATPTGGTGGGGTPGGGIDWTSQGGTP